MTTNRTTIAARADDTPPTETHKYPQGILFPYSLLDAATRGNIDEYGNINYLEIKGNAQLAQFIDAVAHADVSLFPTFDIQITDPKTGRVNKTVTDRSAELVFWINAYNGSIIYTIAEQYPIANVDKVKDFDTAKTHVIAGENYSFQELRKKIQQFDPRALFTLISGTRGGILPAQNAYRFTNLNANLDAAVRAFINNPNNISINRIQNVVTVNDFFKQLNDAFEPKRDRRQWGGIRYLISAYTDKGSDQRYLTNSEYQLDFVPIKPELNDKTR